MTGIEYRLKMFVSIDLTVGSRSNFFSGVPRQFSMGLHGINTTRRRRPVGAIPPTRTEYRLKRSVSINPTVGSRSNFVTSFRRLFSMELRGIRTTRRRRPVGGIPMTGIEYRLKRSVSIELTVGSRQIVSRVSGGCFPWS